ncbi:MAG: hypothetical protein KDA83_03635 [Planctomycetales bacterium]|nr:hypothetical protein [Planctomycetales bacterium]
MSKSYLKLRHSEGIVVQAAAQIYGAYIVAGKVAAGSEAEFIQKSMDEAISLAELADDRIVSDGEVEGGEGF